MLATQYACTCPRYWRSRAEKFSKFPRRGRLAEVVVDATPSFHTDT